MRTNGFLNIIGDVTDSSEKLRRDQSGIYFFQLQEILTEAIDEQDDFPEIHRQSLVQALLSAMHVVETVAMSYRHKNG